MIDLELVPPNERVAVEHALAARYRPDDGHTGSATLREMIEGGRFVGKCSLLDGRFGLLLNWPGVEQPQIMVVPGALFSAVRLPLVEAPPH